MQLQYKRIGAVAGLVMGCLIVRFGFIAAVFVMALAAVGWTFGRVLDGEIDVTQLLGRRDDLD